ncbi:hypothetical protein VTK56DRAFT_6497 [Thermocarpiscus australiensis]
MAKTKITSRLPFCATVFMRLRLPPDFDIPGSEQDVESPKINEKYTRCFQALRQVHDFHYIKCARLVEDPLTAIVFVSAFSPEALEALLGTPQYKDCLAALGLEQPPPYCRTVNPVWAVHLKPGRMTIATFSFPYPATPEQREAFHMDVGGLRLPDRFQKDGPFRLIHPRAWVRGPQKLPDGREVENALLLQRWPTREMEEVSAGEERERRQRWMQGMADRLGLLAISMDRYDIYDLE